MKVLIFPKGNNPYQELLYKELRQQHPDDHFTYVDAIRRNFLFYPFIFLLKRLQGYRIIHIHWLVFSLSLGVPFAKTISYVYTLICLYSLKILGYKIVWTVHDVIPHDEQTTDDISIATMLSKIATIKIVHSSATITRMRESGLNINDTVIISHGSYLNVYPHNIKRSQARRKLNIHQNEFVILFFGLIKPYKGINDLIESVAKVKSKEIRLVIAGKCIDPILYNSILTAKKSIKFDFYEGYVLDEDVATYFEASNVVCLPFSEITTSGSVLLALSFGKPIIAPRMGALIDLPDDVGFLYDSSKKSSLLDSLNEAISSHKLDKMSISAIQYSNTLSWDRIAGKTYQLYEKIYI